MAKVLLLFILLNIPRSRSQGHDSWSYLKELVQSSALAKYERSINYIIKNVTITFIQFFKTAYYPKVQITGSQFMISIEGLILRILCPKYQIYMLNQS